MDDARSLSEQCELVRFALDEAGAHHGAFDPMLPDLIARVRSESLHVSQRTAPAIGRMAELVGERLALTAPAEVYIQADSAINAFAPSSAHLERPVVILNSGLVKLLSPTELAFALGHELGHVGLGHTHSPRPTARNELDALWERSQQRYAEISADRVGLLASRSTFVAANVLIKTASGLPSSSLGFDIDAFIAQMDRSPEEMSREWELELTHPSLPFRLWALLKFSHSDVYAQLSGQGGSTVPIEDIDAEIGSRLDAMGDGRIDRLEQDALERALTWIGAAHLLRTGAADEIGRAQLEAIVGRSRAQRVLDFGIQHGSEAVLAKARDASDVLRSTSAATQARFREAMAAFLPQIAPTSTS